MSHKPTPDRQQLATKTVMDEKVTKAMTQNLELEEPKTVSPMSDKEFSELGLPFMVYVQEIALSTAQRLFPEEEDLPQDNNDLPQDQAIYAIHAANGTPILLAYNMDEAYEMAFDNELEIQPLQ